MDTLYSKKPVSTYVAKKVSQPLTIDGDLTKEVWQKSEKSHRFVDVIDGHPGLYDTRVRALG